MKNITLFLILIITSIMGCDKKKTDPSPTNTTGDTNNITSTTYYVSFDYQGKHYEILEPITSWTSGSDNASEDASITVGYNRFRFGLIFPADSSLFVSKNMIGNHAIIGVNYNPSKLYLCNAYFYMVYAKDAIYKEYQSMDDSSSTSYNEITSVKYIPIGQYNNENHVHYYDNTQNALYAVEGNFRLRIINTDDPTDISDITNGKFRFPVFCMKQ